jgi:hypothetical protein
VIEPEPAVFGLAFGVEPRAESEPAFEPSRRISDWLPIAPKSDVQLCEELQLVRALESMLAGYKTELVIALAGKRLPGRGAPAAQTWGPGAVQLPATSEFFSDELAHVLGCSVTAAAELADTSCVLLTRLPATQAALAEGRLDWPRARAMAAELGWAADQVPDAVVRLVEAEVLPRATEYKIPTTGLSAAVCDRAMEAAVPSTGQVAGSGAPCVLPSVRRDGSRSEGVRRGLRGDDSLIDQSGLRVPCGQSRRPRPNPSRGAL